MSSSGAAVVIGASMGGLLAARALHEAYGKVVIVDRDALPDSAAARRGVPQGRQLHVLLSRGREALEELFAGLTDELRLAGAPLVDLHSEVNWHNDGYLMRRAPSSLLALGLSRPLLEHAVRARVAALPGVEVRSGTEVVGLVTDSDRRRVTGVRTSAGIVEADLVVDAGGRACRTPVWLGELGYDRPAEERVRVGVTYVTRTYRRHPGLIGDLAGAITNAVPGSPRAGIVAAMEGDRFAIALSGMLGEEPPTDDAGMADFAGTLPLPEMAEIIRTAEPTSDAVAMRFPTSVRRRYERLRRFPDGYLVVADGLCSFNPIYGQGITVAALEALLLRRLVTTGTHDLARRFFRGASRLIDAPWSIAVGTDLRFAEVEGRRGPRVRFVNAYVHRVHLGATADPVLGAAFLRVLNLVDPPTRLLAPGTALRVLRGMFRRAVPTAPAAAAPLPARTSGPGLPS
ncbi:squalene monooxygenase [Phytohabitans houttuyneae]|uniref:FAD-binding monooxygenase n=1 Tax=Phytohabitans houttuyneae TaxID=1076126 RepID=A0A6V8KI54_9ACTN|nr:squalene monooxygenase [Phytohabitans houttuyneae]GFJ81387.1 FAD-binding monooxygenase [Phytohabitans houttuyneae]